MYNIIILYYIMEHWDSRQKAAVNVTDKLITSLLMLILSTAFTCVSYIKYLKLHYVKIRLPKHSE